MYMYYECTHIISSRYPVERDGILASLSQHPGLWRTWRSTGRRQLPWSLQQQNCMQHVHGVTTISRVVETVSARRPTPRYELRSDLTVLSVGMYSLYIPVPDLPAWSESAECFMLDRDPAKSLYYTLTVSPLLGRQHTGKRACLARGDEAQEARSCHQRVRSELPGRRSGRPEQLPLLSRAQAISG
jgi:hypothetical protein